MDVEVDHYAVLGLPSGEEGANLSDKEISKAYRLKALELHPDKRLDDPNAHAHFQKLKTSYDILKDGKARNLFHHLLRLKSENLQRQSKQESKRRKMTTDLDDRELAAFTPNPTTKARDEEERIARKLKEEIARIRAMHADKATSPACTDGGQGRLDKEKVLKVSWKKVGEDYTAQTLRELFEKFGHVEDVLIKSSKKKGSALVVMASKDAAVAATTGILWENLSNPLLVLPLQPAIVIPSSRKPTETYGPKLSNIVGAGYQAFEDSVLQKLQKRFQNGMTSEGGRPTSSGMASGSGRANPSRIASSSGLATPSAMGKGSSQLQKTSRRFGDVIN